METTRLIEKNYWSQFMQTEYKDLTDENSNGKSTKTKHDGHKFEDLVGDLLNLE